MHIVCGDVKHCLDLGRYGVPASDADKLEDTVMERIYADALKELKSRERCPRDVLRRTAISTLLNKTTMFSPKVLLDAGAVQLSSKKTTD